MAGMDFREATAGMAEPEARAALVPDLLRTGLVELVAMAEMLPNQVMAATVELVM
jgi:hypothetical protein